MHVYFVRHGETLLNRRHIHQSPNTPLSVKGQDDARTTAEYLRGVNPTLLLSSEYTRARETAGVIGLCTGLTPAVNGLFFEIERPSKFYGLSHFSIETFWYVLLSIIHKDNPTWRYDDAENFSDIQKRAERALAYLESLSSIHSSVVVVSHTIFINVMVAYLCRNKMLTLKDLIFTFLHVERMKNGAVLHVEYTEKTVQNTCSWRLIDTV